MNYVADLDRAKKAELLLENDLLKAALDAIESEIVDQWKDCPARDSQGKEALWQLMKTAQKFRSILIGHIETGKIAKAQMAKIEQESSVFRFLKTK